MTTNHTPVVAGLHHVTAIASDPQRNVAFYTGLLGLRLVKKTVNFDDPSAYHLYYGDETGQPGTIVTFFYWAGMASQGRVGAGQMTAFTFSAPVASLTFWEQRLREAGVKAERTVRFGEDVVAFADPDGIPVEIVGTTGDARLGWTGSGIGTEHALRGMHTAQLTVRNASATEGLLTDDMGYRLVRREGDRARFEAGPGGSGRYVDVIADTSAAPSGTGGSGTIHHIAFRVADDAGELAMRDRLNRAGFMVSPVRDRNYFRSIYYRERNGILFEIATDVPGFAIDETVAELGTMLKLPAMFEAHRHAIEKTLPPLELATPAA
ncbi:MAG: ring-cleaving dioxygenase [Verrucomicrobiota bacterium]